MHKPRFHLFLCNSFRTSGEPKGVCHQKAGDLLQYLQAEVSDRGIDAIISTTSCLNVCEKGPVLIVYPDAWWYYNLDEGKIDTILDALEQDSPVTELLMA